MFLGLVVHLFQPLTQAFTLVKFYLVGCNGYLNVLITKQVKSAKYSYE